MSEWHQELRLGWLSTHLHLLINCFSDILASHLMYIMTFLHSVLFFLSRPDVTFYPCLLRGTVVSHLWLRRNYLQGRCYLKGRPPQKTESLFSQCFYLFNFMGFFFFFFNSGGYSVIFCLIYQTHSSSPNCRAIDLSLTCQWQFLFDNKKYFKYIWKEREERK